MVTNIVQIKSPKENTEQEQSKQGPSNKLEVGVGSSAI